MRERENERERERKKERKKERKRERDTEIERRIQQCVTAKRKLTLTRVKNCSFKIGDRTKSRLGMFAVNRKKCRLDGPPSKRSHRGGG